VQASYEVDLWGRVRNTVEAGRDDALAASGDLASAQLSLQAQLADCYMQLRGLDQQIALLQETIQAYERALKLTQTLHAGGIVSGLDVSRAQTQLSDARSQWSQSVAQRTLMQDAIAVLVGENASNFSLPSQTAAIALPVVPVGTPSTLLQRRPDVAAAERRVAAANARYRCRARGVVPFAHAQCARRLRKQRVERFAHRTEPRLDARSRHLRSICSTAVIAKRPSKRRKPRPMKPVPPTAVWCSMRSARCRTTLRLLDNLGTASTNQKDASDAAQHALDLSMTQYKHGAVSYLDVVQAQTVALQEKRGLLELDTQRLRASVQLIRALGGGWSADQLARK
jgi:outer membrane protein TolC